jgi:hypothetical protein
MGHLGVSQCSDTERTDVICQRSGSLQHTLLNQWQSAAYLGVALALLPGFLLVAGFVDGLFGILWFLLIPLILAMTSTRLRLYKLAASLSVVGASLAGLLSIMSLYLAFIIFVPPTYPGFGMPEVLACLASFALLGKVSLLWFETIPALWHVSATPLAREQRLAVKTRH